MKPAAEIWMEALLTDRPHATPQRSAGVLWCDGLLQGHPVRYVALIPDSQNLYPRARTGEAGILQGWTLARCLRELLTPSTSQPPRAVIALVDVPSQAYGKREESLCLSLALAAAVDAYATLRESGHPVVTLLVGNAMSGGFLAHGYQASVLLALQDDAVRIQAMGMDAALRITRRTADEFHAAAQAVPPIGYDLASFRKLGILTGTIPCSNRLAPTAQDIELTGTALAQAIEACMHTPHLVPRLHGEGGTALRALSLTVREAMYAQWEEPA